MTDDDYLEMAFVAACRGVGHTRPNPPVGAVIVRSGRVIGQGFHQRCGADHAEVAALGSCTGSPKGATLYVTLEPCSRPGRVGACTDAIIAAGIKRVVYAETDPNPKNRGRAARVLRRHGIECQHYRPHNPRLAVALRNLLVPFRKHVTTGLPYVIVKLAMSLDGRICDLDGNAQWISSPAARQQTGRYREVVDAIMVGAETVRRDNPSLLSHGRRNDDLVRVVLTRSGKLPKSAQVFTDGRNPTWVLKGDDLRATLAELGRRGMMCVLCEGGLKLATALAEAGLVDEWITVLAPCVIGSRPIAKKLAAAYQNSNVTSAGDIVGNFKILGKTK